MASPVGAVRRRLLAITAVTPWPGPGRQSDAETVATALGTARPDRSSGRQRWGALRLDDNTPDQTGHVDGLRAGVTAGSLPRAWSAHAYWSEHGQEMVGVSLWESKDSCDAWRASAAEARRREAMAPYVLEERDAFSRGRELAMPATR
jgi:hypothetical protein